MKKSILSVIAFGVAVASSFGQGALIFSNLGSGAGGSSIAVNQAPFFDVDGITKLTGTSFSAQLYYGVLGTLEGALVNTGAPIVNFNTGGFSGYFASQPSVTLNGVGIGSTASVQFRAWDNRTGATWETATTRGQSGVLTTLGLGDPLNAQSLPVVSSLASVTLTTVPEPATVALGLFGAAGLFIRRRK